MMESPAFSVDAPEFVPGGRVLEDQLRSNHRGNCRQAKPAPAPPANVVLDDMFEEDDDDELNFQFDEELEAVVSLLATKLQGHSWSTCLMPCLVHSRKQRQRQLPASPCHRPSLAPSGRSNDFMLACIEPLLGKGMVGHFDHLVLSRQERRGD